MSDQQDKTRSAYLERVSDQLTKSLRRCSTMINDYRTRLIAANSNEPGFMLSDVDSKADEEDIA